MDAPVIERSRTSTNAMHGIRSISGPWNTSNVWIVPCRPHPERSDKYAFFARLRSGGANNKNNYSKDNKPGMGPESGSLWRKGCIQQELGSTASSPLSPSDTQLHTNYSRNSYPLVSPMILPYIIPYRTPL